jgi:hypothetical protein
MEYYPGAKEEIEAAPKEEEKTPELTEQGLNKMGFIDFAQVLAGSDIPAHIWERHLKFILGSGLEPLSSFRFLGERRFVTKHLADAVKSSFSRPSEDWKPEHYLTGGKTEKKVEFHQFLATLEPDYFRQNVVAGKTIRSPRPSVYYSSYYSSDLFSKFEESKKANK